MKQRESVGPGEESVWDYPRPPRIERTDKNIEVIIKGRTIARTNRAFRILETSHPPVYYIPPDDVDSSVLKKSSDSSYCEYKGKASYYDIDFEGLRISQAAWYYPKPLRGYEKIAGYVAFYPGKMDRCTVNGETVKPQAGGFYGGWITKEIKGPFKGEPGTMFW